MTRSSVAVLFLVMSFSGNVWANTKSDFKDESRYPTISKQELTEIASKKTAVIVDVNSEESFNKVHVPGAVHFKSHKKDFAKVLPKDKTDLIVAYCGSVKCGAWKKAAEEACTLGYTNIRHFKEGIKGWVASD